MTIKLISDKSEFKPNMPDNKTYETKFYKN